MAARLSRRKQEPVTCEALLQKLKKGQNELKSSLKKVHSRDRKVANKDERREATKLKRTLPRSTFERPLNRVDDLPRKRARLLQLSPDHMDYTVEHKPHAKASNAHIRRLSSTPKETKKCSSKPTPPSLDVSLEEAILTKERGRKEHHKKRRESSPSVRTQSSYSAAPLPSPKMSRIVVDTSHKLTTPGSSRKRRSVAKGVSPSPATSGKSKKRGLSVSFVQVGDENDDESGSLKKKRGNLRPVHRQSVAKEDLGASLIESLNSSRYGALDRSLSQTRKQHLFPRKYAGDDPRLGYDWIAGLLDASEAYLSEKDDDYFDDIKEFRRVNHAECFRPLEALLPGSLKEDAIATRSSTAGGSSMENQRDCCTTCVSSYMMNDRLFPIPINPASGPESLDLSVCCPVCEGKHSRVEKSPTRFVRVSVPRSALQVSSKVRPHRRRSFDPTDSMGLAKHCLAGWESAQPSVIPPQSQVDLKSSVNQTSSTSHQELLNTSHSVEYSLRSRASMR